MKTNDLLTTEQIDSLLTRYAANHTHEEYAALLDKCLSKMGQDWEKWNVLSDAVADGNSVRAMVKPKGDAK